MRELGKNVSNLKLFLLCISISILASHSAHAAKRGPNIALGEHLTQSLNQIMDQSIALQTLVIEGRAERAKVVVGKIISQLESARRSSTDEPINIRSHLLKLIQASETKLGYLIGLRGEAFRLSFKEALETMAHFPRIYKLDQRYRIFFCDKDKSSWVQIGVRPRNPVSHEKWINCGSTVE